MPYYNSDPKRDHNSDNPPCDIFRLGVAGLKQDFGSRVCLGSRVWEGFTAAWRVVPWEGGSEFQARSEHSKFINCSKVPVPKTKHRADQKVGSPAENLLEGSVCPNCPLFARKGTPNPKPQHPSRVAN